MANPGYPANYGNSGGGNGGSGAFGGGGGGAGGSGGNANGPNNTGGSGGSGQQFPNYTGSLIGVPALSHLVDTLAAVEVAVDHRQVLEDQQDLVVEVEVEMKNPIAVQRCTVRTILAAVAADLEQPPDRDMVAVIQQVLVLLLSDIQFHNF